MPFEEDLPEWAIRMAWTPETLALLGKMADSTVAKRIGLSVILVRRKRVELKIAPWQPNMMSTNVTMNIHRK